MRRITSAAISILTTSLLLAGCTAPATTAPAAPQTSAAPTTAATSASATPEATPTDTATTDATGQSVSEACVALTAPMLELSSAMQKSIGKIRSNPKKAAQAMKTFITTFETAIGEIQNAEVKAQATKALKALKAMAVTVKKFKGTLAQATALSKAAQKVQTEFTAIGTLCDKG